MFLSVRHDTDMSKRALKIDDLAEEFLRCPDRHGTGSEKWDRYLDRSSSTGKEIWDDHYGWLTMISNPFAML